MESIHEKRPGKAPLETAVPVKETAQVLRVLSTAPEYEHAAYPTLLPSIEESIEGLAAKETL